jgi:hypothetical protein
MENSDLSRRLGEIDRKLADAQTGRQSILDALKGDELGNPGIVATLKAMNAKMSAHEIDDARRFGDINRAQVRVLCFVVSILVTVIVAFVTR